MNSSILCQVPGVAFFGLSSFFALSTLIASDRSRTFLTKYVDKRSTWNVSGTDWAAAEWEDPSVKSGQAKNAVRKQRTCSRRAQERMEKVMRVDWRQCIFHSHLSPSASVPLTQRHHFSPLASVLSTTGPCPQRGPAKTECATLLRFSSHWLFAYVENKKILGLQFQDCESDPRWNTCQLP